MVNNNNKGLAAVTVFHSLKPSGDPYEMHSKTGIKGGIIFLIGSQFLLIKTAPMVNHPALWKAHRH